MNENQLSIDEGSINFWLKAGSIDFQEEGKFLPLFQNTDSQGNSIFILRDSDKKIKMFHVKMGKGRTDIEYNVSELSNSKDHMFTFTWSVDKKEIRIYIDGVLAGRSEIKY